jgi:hypothetical protein
MRNAINKRAVGAFLSGALLILGLNMLRGSNTQPSHHVYELRMYHVSAGKMDALKARFADHVDALFNKHHMKSIGYWQPEDAPSSQNLFIYVLEHPSREEAKTNWDAFHEDPEWKKVKAESEKDGPLTDQIDSYFMDPTGFSKLQ